METESDDYRRIRASVEKSVTKYAERSLFFLNPDDVVVKNIISGLIRNKLKYGFNYCPCRDVKGILKEDAKNICPCQTHKEEIIRHGTCECGLFVNKAYFEAKKILFQV